MIYAVVNEKGVEKFIGNSFLKRNDWGGEFQGKLTTRFPFAFEEKPVFSGRKEIIFTRRPIGHNLILSESDIDWYEESELPKLIQNSFELLADEFKHRNSHDFWKAQSLLFDMLMELNIKEKANDFPLTKALLLDWEAINYSPFTTSVFKLQTAFEAKKFFKGAKQG